MEDKMAIYVKAFNAEKTLPATLDSILNQTYKNFEIYIEENGSTDRTFEIAKESKLDMVTCGWDFVRPDRVDHRIPEKNEIIEKEKFASRLPYYDKFMGPVWNKLFRTDAMCKNITYYENKFSRLFKDGVYFYGAEITEELCEFIMNIYFKSTRSTMELLERDTRYGLKQKMEQYHEMFHYRLMDEMFSKNEERYL